MVLAINPLNRLASFIGDISKGLVGASRVYEILALPIEVRDAPGAVVPARIAGALRFENVTFAYKADAAPVLLRPRTPASKRAKSSRWSVRRAREKRPSSNLVPRFYDPQGGRITLDGADLATLSLGALREAIAIVPQEAMLFSGTIAENIRYGRLDATAAEIEAAAREANADEFILDLPLRLRHAGRRPRHAALRRPAPAHLDRPRRRCATRAS